jgi:FHA domain-containing protein
MTLTLRAVSLNDQPLTQPITAQFDLHGGTIGRADHNTLALPDPERHISREQAEIIAGMSGFVIRNVGSSNPIIVRDQPLAHGESAPLLHNDHVRIGRYLLEVIDDAARPELDDATRIPAANDSLPGASGLPWSAPAATRLPDDFDPFASLAPRTPAPPAPARAAPAGAFHDLIPQPSAGSLDDLFGLQGQAGADPLAAFLSDVKPVAGSNDAAGLPSTDPLVLFGGPAPSVPPPEVMHDRTPELRAAFTPPRPQPAVARTQAQQQQPQPASPVIPQPVRAAPAPAPAPVAAPAAAAPPWSGDAAALWAAFCDGVGVPVNPPGGADPETMRMAGSLLRAAIEGTLQLMSVRAATRYELHAQVTVIQARNNNPLKFSPDAQSALEQLLQPPMRGFLPGPAAVTEAMDDLVGHAIGTMAGTRSALDGVLARFAPRDLEAKLAARSVVDAVLPMARKARLWELYLQHHEAIREEAQEDFHALFGKAFLAAYEQQLDQLRRERPRA